MSKAWAGVFFFGFLGVCGAATAAIEHEVPRLTLYVSGTSSDTWNAKDFSCDSEQQSSCYVMAIGYGYGYTLRNPQCTFDGPIRFHGRDGSVTEIPIESWEKTFDGVSAGMGHYVVFKLAYRDRGQGNLYNGWTEFPGGECSMTVVQDVPGVNVLVYPTFMQVQGGGYARMTPSVPLRLYADSSRYEFNVYTYRSVVVSADGSDSAKIMGRERRYMNIPLQVSLRGGSDAGDKFIIEDERGAYRVGSDLIWRDTEFLRVRANRDYNWSYGAKPESINIDVSIP